MRSTQRVLYPERAGLRSLAPELRSGLIALTSVDDDGLTNTQEE